MHYRQYTMHLLPVLEHVLQLTPDNLNPWKLKLPTNTNLFQFPMKVQVVGSQLYIQNKMHLMLFTALNEMMWTAGIQMKWLCDHRSESQFKQLQK